MKLSEVAFLVSLISLGIVFVANWPKSLPPLEPEPPKQSVPEDWIKYDPRDCKFRFADEVEITKGLYRGSKGVILDLKGDGYLIDIYGYLISKPGGNSFRREPMLYGVPETDLKLVEKK